MSTPFTVFSLHVRQSFHVIFRIVSNLQSLVKELLYYHYDSVFPTHPDSHSSSRTLFSMTLSRSTIIHTFGTLSFLNPRKIHVLSNTVLRTTRSPSHRTLLLKVLISSLSYSVSECPVQFPNPKILVTIHCTNITVQFSNDITFTPLT